MSHRTAIDRTAVRVIVRPLPEPFPGERDLYRHLSTSTLLGMVDVFIEAMDACAEADDPAAERFAWRLWNECWDELDRRADFPVEGCQ